MLPVVRGEAETRKQIVMYSVVLIAGSLSLVAIHAMGGLYLVGALTFRRMAARPGGAVGDYTLYRAGAHPLLVLKLLPGDHLCADGARQRAPLTLRTG